MWDREHQLPADADEADFMRGGGGHKLAGARARISLPGLGSEGPPQGPRVKSAGHESEALTSRHAPSRQWSTYWHARWSHEGGRRQPARSRCRAARPSPPRPSAPRPERARGRRGQAARLVDKQCLGGDLAEARRERAVRARGRPPRAADGAIRSHGRPERYCQHLSATRSPTDRTRAVTRARQTSRTSSSPGRGHARARSPAGMTGPPSPVAVPCPGPSPPTAPRAGRTTVDRRACPPFTSPPSSAVPLALPEAGSIHLHWAQACAMTLRSQGYLGS